LQVLTVEVIKGLLFVFCEFWTRFFAFCFVFVLLEKVML